MPDRPAGRGLTGGIAMGLRGLVVLASHLHCYFSSPLPALDLPRNVRGFSCLSIGTKRSWERAGECVE